MFRWIFRKSGNEPGTTAAPATTDASPVAGSAEADVDWAASLAQARGDDEALLALAVAAATPLKIKQAAVEGLDSEAALKRAEREFRSHDRRVHQFAKQRMLAKAAQGQTREQAAQLLEAARSLRKPSAPDAAPEERVPKSSLMYRGRSAPVLAPVWAMELVACCATSRQSVVRLRAVLPIASRPRR